MNIKILHINTYDKGGGAEDFAYDFVNSSLGIDAHLAVKFKITSSPKVVEMPQNIVDKFFIVFDKILWKIGVKKTIKQIFSITEELNFTYKKLLKLKEYKDADIVHLHNIHGGYFDLDALAKIARDKLVVWSLHDMWAMTGGEAFTFQNENYKVGISTTPYNNFYPLNSPLIDRRQYFMNKKKKIYTEIADKLFIIPGSKWLAECFKSSYVYNQSLYVNVIHESINTAIYKNNNQRGWKVPRVLIINSNNPFKGADLYEIIFPLLKCTYDLHIIGNQLPVSNHANQIHYYSYLSKEDLCNVFNNVDILIFPSKAENFPLTVLAAMSCGVCVVGSSIGGITEQLQDGNGILFNINNIDEVLMKLKNAIEDISHTRAIGNNASVSVHEKYNIDLMYEKYNVLYKTILQ